MRRSEPDDPDCRRLSGCQHHLRQRSLYLPFGLCSDHAEEIIGSYSFDFSAVRIAAIGSSRSSPSSHQEFTYAPPPKTDAPNVKLLVHEMIFVLVRWSGSTPTMTRAHIASRYSTRIIFATRAAAPLIGTCASSNAWSEALSPKGMYSAMVVADPHSRIGAPVPLQTRR